jgi:UDP-N-acetylmuramoyl-tripeptide--D-alanyl-D-alanine ligase
MARITLEDVQRLRYHVAQNLNRLEGKAVRGVSIDSRTVRRGEIFFAVRGERFDGHDFVSKAFDKGAVLTVVEREWYLKHAHIFPDRSIVVVGSTLQALGELANIHRRKFDVPVLAITGSNGKTTTKEMVAAILSRRFKVLKTDGNLNNQIGLPLMLFRLSSDHEVAVLEMGTNHFGEIESLCRIAEPTHGLVTNIARAHLEFFGTLEGVARAKAELFRWMADSRMNGLAFVNSDDKWIVHHSRILRKKLRYGFNSRSDVVGKFLGMNELAQPSLAVTSKARAKQFQATLQASGKHNIYSALAAAAVGLEFGVGIGSIKSTLQDFPSSTQRMEILRVGKIAILNDTYNANPDSTTAALDTLRNIQCKGRKIVVLGDMLELGAHSREEHRKIGLQVADYGFGYLLAFGPESKFMAVAAKGKVSCTHHFKDKRSLSDQLCKIVEKGDIVLIKGSRGMRMEEVTNTLIERLRSQKPKTVS